jgi:hypothetical protein
MNCIHPTAPAVETDRSVPKSVSISLIAASTCQGTPYCTAAAL